MPDYLRASFAEEVQNAQYFTKIADSTPDVSHVDQLIAVLRYVKRDGEITEPFFFFTPIQAHTSKHIAEIVLNSIKLLGLGIKTVEDR